MAGPFGTSDRVTLTVKPEAAFGAIPATGVPYLLRFASESLKYDVKTVQSQEITGDRQIRDLIIVDADVTGDLGGEAQYGEYDFLDAYLLAGTWGNYAGAAGDSGLITVTITLANTITASAGTPFANLAVGQWFRMSGMVNAANNAVFQIVTKSDTVITTGAGLLTNEAITATCHVYAARLVNGTTLVTIDAERKNTDLTLFECFRGIGMSSGGWSFKTGSILERSFSVMGKNALPIAGTTALTGTPAASQTGTVMNSVSNVGSIYEGGALLTATYLKSMDLKVNPNLRALKAIGNLGPAALALGDFDAQITFEGYFADSTIYNKFLNATATSLSVRLTDSAGQGYVITFPNGKYSSATRPTGGRNQDVVVAATFQALKDTTSGVTMIVDRFGGAVTVWT